MPAPAYRGRFAPSPTGALHFGSLLTALGSWLRARQAGGTWLVRIEDLDPPREVAGAAQQQLRMLQAFGMESDETVIWQSRRSEIYRSVLDLLQGSGLLFECRCSRSELAQQAGIHRTCAPLPDRRRSPALRIRVPDIEIAFVDRVQGAFRQALANEVGDFVLRRVEGLIAYQLAAVVDDALQDITEIVRGSDLLDSTPRQIWLQRTLGYATPAYAHLPLALDANSQKLGKSLAALPLETDDPVPALRAAWRFLGQDETALRGIASLRQTLSVAIDVFEIDRVPRASAAAIPQTGGGPV